MTRKWMAVIPRRSNNFEGVTANGIGMMGIVWLMNEAQFEAWKLRGPAKVLSELGVPLNSPPSEECKHE